MGPWYLIMHVVFAFHERAHAARVKGFKRPLLLLHAGVLPVVEFVDLEAGRRKTPARKGKQGKVSE